MQLKWTYFYLFLVDNFCEVIFLIWFFNLEINHFLLFLFNLMSEINKLTLVHTYLFFSPFFFNSWYAFLLKMYCFLHQWSLDTLRFCRLFLKLWEVHKRHILSEHIISLKNFASELTYVKKHSNYEDSSSSEHQTGVMFKEAHQSVLFSLLLKKQLVWSLLEGDKQVSEDSIVEELDREGAVFKMGSQDIKRLESLNLYWKFVWMLGCLWIVKWGSKKP